MIIAHFHLKMANVLPVTETLKETPLFPNSTYVSRTVQTHSNSTNTKTHANSIAKKEHSKLMENAKNALRIAETVLMIPNALNVCQALNAT